jgi:hypothetical protein
MLTQQARCAPRQESNTDSVQAPIQGWWRAMTGDTAVGLKREFTLDRNTVFDRLGLMARKGSRRVGNKRAREGRMERSHIHCDVQHQATRYALANLLAVEHRQHSLFTRETFFSSLHLAPCTMTMLINLTLIIRFLCCCSQGRKRPGRGDRHHPGDIGGGVFRDPGEPSAPAHGPPALHASPAVALTSFLRHSPNLACSKP